MQNEERVRAEKYQLTGPFAERGRVRAEKDKLNTAFSAANVLARVMTQLLHPLSESERHIMSPSTNINMLTANVFVRRMRFEIPTPAYEADAALMVLLQRVNYS